MADVVCQPDEAAVYAQVFGDWDSEVGGASVRVRRSETAIMEWGFIVVEMVVASGSLMWL